MTTHDTPEAALAAALRRTYRQDGWDSPIAQAAAILATLDGWTLRPDEEWTAMIHVLNTERVEKEAEIARLRAAPLDVWRVVKAIGNVAARHGLKKDPPAMPLALARIYGYSTTPDDMDSQIAAEYAALSQEASDANVD